MSLLAALLERVPERPELEPWLKAHLESAHRLWPDLELDEKQVAATMGRHLADATVTLESLSGTELLLAAAALAHDASALEHFDRLLVTEVRRAVAPLDTSNALVDDVGQLARERLLIDQKLADYSGRGPLGAWLRAVAVRLALNAKRPGAREEPTEAMADAPLADPDPELALLRARHRAEFKSAFEQGLQALTARERTLLRLTACDGLTLAHIAKMYGKDTSTASRWLAEARATLRAKTREVLSQTLKLDSAELESVLRAADSELNLSLVRLLT